MKTPIAILTLLFPSLLLVAGCGGGEEGETPSGAPEETTPPNTTAPAAEPETAQAPTLNIIKADGERVEVAVEIADTRTEQARGLMERTELAEDAGMLLVPLTKPLDR